MPSAELQAVNDEAAIPDLARLYEQMVLVRVLEQELENLSNTGEVSDLHLNRGQEAIAIGVCAALRPADRIVVHHRTIAHAVAKGIPLYPLVAEILGKADGVCGGMSGEMHLSYPPVGFMFSFQLVGTCVKPDTLILGDNKPIAALNPGSLALGRGGLNRVSDVMERVYSGDMLRVKACGMLPVEMTPEHPCWTITSIDKSVQRPSGIWTHGVVYSLGQWKSADVLRPKNRNQHGDFLAIPRLKGACTERSLSLAPFIKGHFHESAEYVQAVKMREDGTLYKDIRRALLARFQRPISLSLIHAWVTGEYMPRFRLADLPLDVDTAWLLGLYVAEGSYDGRKGPTFTLHCEEKTLIQRLRKIATKLGIKWSVCRRRNSLAVNVTLFSNALGKALTQWCGKGAAHKQMPEVILLHEDVSILQAFLDGHRDGDGHTDSNAGRCTHTTISRLLALQLQLGYARLGTFAQVTHKPAWTAATGLRHAASYQVRFPTRPTRAHFAHITEDYIYSPIREVQRIPFVGVVWNIETADNTYLVSNAVVHNCVPIAAGVAWASKYVHKTDDIVAVFHGDAATSNAQWHEGIGLAKIQRVPLLLVCENNGLAGNIRPEFYMPVGSVAQRAEGYGVRSHTIDGNHVDEVFKVAREAIEYVRRESAPFLLECDTTRFAWHKLGQRDVRGPEEMARLHERDPILYLAKFLGYSPDQQEAILAEVSGVVQDVLVRARAAAPPTALRVV